ncbi:Flp family type IVb pilin [Allobranchiibius sp. CTAmp26]|uniref:Flp family type IVb pilin n=1 Tax=Allobranchiibius sp. CTAmp26 TaxID=2815214 RepID=UPI001AA155F4|nr:Flp family type IVb pilin [Allobranchiibius sp. CTAmp26]MBO1755507.1 Flp family type IVb pilin [Allobranchiibius sp. CTAmp26]
MNAVAAYFFTTLVGLQDRLQTRKERGATAVEYGLLVGLIAVVIIVAVTALGSQLKVLFNDIVKSLGGTPAP